MEKRSERSGRFLFLGKGRTDFDTEVAEEEHRVHREDNPKSTARNGCATGVYAYRFL